jgi:ATP-binding cassette subfamily F protein 3/macrolide transport system ATP-binding/permease protein
LELWKTEIKLYSGNYEFYEIQKELEQNQNDENYNEFAKKYGELKKKISKEYWKKSSLQHRKAWPDTDPRRKFGREYAQNSSWWEIRRYKKELEILLKNKPEIEKKKPLNFDLSIEEKVFWWISANNIEFKYPNSKNGISAEKFSVQNWEKVAIFWSNASGKTTFLKLLTWELKLQKWEIKISPNIKIWNYSQEKQYLEECELNLIEFLEKNCKDKKVLSLQHNVLKKFNFSEDDKKIKVSLLSPWQKNRLLLALFSLVKYNTIILDEPTNHLDLEAIDELEKTLQSFNWNLIVVSHDRWFMSEVNFNKKYEAKNGKLIERL